MSIDDRALKEEIAKSQDLQSDAIRQSKATLPELADIREGRRGQRPDPARVETVNAARRNFLRDSGIGTGGILGRGLFAGALGAALVAIIGRPASADTDLDIDICQTAASLENLAVATYSAALDLPFIANGNEVVVQFARTTRSQHSEHGMAFNAQAEQLGGEPQNQPNPQFAPVVEEATPGLTDPLAVVQLAAQLENVATTTYLVNTTLLEDTRTIELMGSVMGVETQHLATLRAVEALLEGGGESLIAVPTDVAALPAAAGSVAFPDALHPTPDDLVAPPESGAVQ